MKTNLRTLQGDTRGDRTASFPSMLESFKGEIARALPRHLNADNVARIALTCFRMNARLAECHPASVFACIIQASQLGLRPGLLGECYLIPYKGQCTLQLGYQGLLELVRRSGLVEGVSARAVYEGDLFEVEWGTKPHIVHRPCLDGTRGALVHVYAVAQLRGGGVHAELMSRADIERIKSRSQNVVSAAQYGKQTPWDSDFDEMARKTVLRRICKYLPKSPELALALALDDAATRGGQALTIGDAIGGGFVPDSLGYAEPTEDQEPPAEVQPHPPGRQASKARRPAREPAANDDLAPTLAQFVEALNGATSADTAALVVDAARDELTPEDLDDLAAQYRAKWEDSAE